MNINVDKTQKIAYVWGEEQNDDKVNEYTSNGYTVFVLKSGNISLKETMSQIVKSRI